MTKNIDADKLKVTVIIFIFIQKTEEAANPEAKMKLKPKQKQKSSFNLKKILLASFLFCLMLMAACGLNKPGETGDGAETSAGETSDGETSAGETADTETDGPEETTAPVYTDPVIHSITELNSGRSEINSHEGEGSAYGMELNYRSVYQLGSAALGGVTNPFYPRIKKLPDGSYIMFYQNGQTGPDVYYTKSEDLVSWSKPEILFRSGHDSQIGANVLYATADALVLSNGELLVVVSFRRADNYTDHPAQCGLITKRSTDNGKTWGERQIIYLGCTWEPSLLQLKNGELQVYWTNTTGYPVTEPGAKTSTGTAILRSFDNGVTWTGSASKIYTGQIVSQTATEKIQGIQFYTDQMPVAIELQKSGRIVLAIEARMNRTGTYRVKLSYSSDNWAKALERKEEGPADKDDSLGSGAGPYIRQFPSGEVYLQYASGGYLTYRMTGADGVNFGSAFKPYSSFTYTLWATCELIGSHTILNATDYKDETGKNPTKLTIGQMQLNHRIDAKKTAVTADGNCYEWANNTDALFLGSESQAQSSLRVAYDDNADTISFLVERLDDYLSPKDTGTIFFAAASDAASIYKLTYGPEGVSEFTYSGGRAVSADMAKCGVYISGTVGKDSDKDTGYCIEITIDRNLLEGISGELWINHYMNNTDKGKDSPTDITPKMPETKPSTWYKAVFK